jgi:hypothetical protein
LEPGDFDGDSEDGDFGLEPGDVGPDGDEPGEEDDDFEGGLPGLLEGGRQGFVVEPGFPLAPGEDAQRTGGRFQGCVFFGALVCRSCRPVSSPRSRTNQSWRWWS